MVDLTGGERLYVIGDIHGRLDLLDGVLARIEADIADRPGPDPRIIFLGDYVDRGPDSRGVIDRLMDIDASRRHASFMLGNHDSYIRPYLHDPDWQDRVYHWLHPAMGGAETLASYGVDGASLRRPAATRDAFAAALPADHLAFLDACALWLRIGGYVFVHAGIRPGIAMARQERDDLIWMREPFLSSRADHGFKVVHGHTIVPQVEHHPNRIAIDTGAIRSGNLACLVLEGTTVELLEAEGRRSWEEGAGVRPAGLVGSLTSGLRGLGIVR